MRNLLDTDAFVVGMLVLILGVYQLASDQNARNGLGNLVTQLCAPLSQVDKTADVRETTSERAPSTAHSAVTQEPSTVVSTLPSQSISHTIPRALAGNSIPAVAQRRQVVYPRANVTVESSGVFQEIPHWEHGFDEMIPIEPYGAAQYRATHGRYPMDTGFGP